MSSVRSRHGALGQLFSRRRPPADGTVPAPGDRPRRGATRSNAPLDRRLLERRQLLVCFGAQPGQRRGVALSPRRVQQFSVDGPQSIEELRGVRLREGSWPRRGGHPVPGSPHRESASSERSAPARSVVSRAITRSRCAGSDSCLRDRLLDSLPTRFLAEAADIGVSLAIPTARRHSSKASSTSASQNSIRTGRRRGPFA